MSTRTLPRVRSLGTHNTLDGAARGTAFADIICFTEAIPAKLERDLMRTHDLYVCRFQKDLVIAVNRALPIHNVKMHYIPVHPGLMLVTPHRGVFWITFDLWGERYAVLCEHRINAAFPPFKRGEPVFRPKMWRLHRRIACRVVRRLKKRGRKVMAAGDYNTIPGVDAYKGLLEEHFEGFDRVCVDADHFEVTSERKMSRAGSDHHRYRVGLKAA